MIHLDAVRMENVPMPISANPPNYNNEDYFNALIDIRNDIIHKGTKSLDSFTSFEELKLFLRHFGMLSVIIQGFKTQCNVCFTGK